MYRKALHICFLLFGFAGFAQECPDMINPLPGATNVPVTTSISWEEVVGVNGYILSLGTTPGGGEIINEQSVGSDTTFNPPLGLPESTLIYVTITLFFYDQPNIVCPSTSFTTENVTTIPECTMLLSPEDGDENVHIGANLNWAYAPRATGYRLTVGTASGSGDIVNSLDVGNTLSYNPPADLPQEATIYVRIRSYNENGPAQNCSEESFTTGGLGDPPGCTMLISPANGEFNVELTTVLEWSPAPGATGYRLYAGSSPFNNDVLDGVVYTSTSVLVINFEPNKTYFVRIIPFNEAGEAQDCPQESFSTILGCGPFFDDDGNLVILSPEITFPDQIGICDNALPTRLNATDDADGYRWYRITDSGNEELISEESFVDIFEVGNYRYEAYNVVNQDGVIIECPDSKGFTTSLSSKAEIIGIDRQYYNIGFTVIAEVTGIGDYEYALNDIDGPYQSFEIFTHLPPGQYTLFVRDKNGCGIAQQSFKLGLPVKGFPPYFSPNGDGIKDFWQYIPPDVDPLPVRVIYIYDRFGKLLDQINPSSQGWDGLYNNTPMPLGGYWYKAITADNRVFSGYFSLIR